MVTAFRAFMEGLIDYAGLFPPARLDLETAIRKFIRYRAGPDAWMLERFIIPASRLTELLPYHEELAVGTSGPVGFSVLLSGGGGANGACDNLQKEIEEILVFQDRQGPSCRIDVLETRLPVETAEASEAERTTEYLRSLDTLLRKSGLDGVELFLEVPPGSLSISSVESAIQGIADLGKTGTAGKGAVIRAGFKLRCGGLERENIPKPDLVARVLVECRDQGTPLKCTAGLHHPIRHHDAGLDAMVHGFFNVFGAGILAHALNLSLIHI